MVSCYHGQHHAWEQAQNHVASGREEEERRAAAAQAAAASSSSMQALPSAKAAAQQRGLQVLQHPVSLQRGSSLDSVSTHFSGKSHRSQASKAKRGRDAEPPEASMHADSIGEDKSDVASSASGPTQVASVSGRAAHAAAAGQPLPALTRSRLRPAKQLVVHAEVPARRARKGREVVQSGGVKAGTKRASMAGSSSKAQQQLAPGGLRQYVSPYSQIALRRISGSKFD